MQNKFIIRDRCVLLLLLFIFSFGTYSLFGNNQSVNLFELVDFQHRVKGLVTDSSGVPIPGVNVEIKGTSQGTFTDNDGIFYLDAAPTDVLILSYIGFKTLEVTVGTSSELPLTLQEDVTNLDAVTVNAGYYTVKERERTGSIVKVTAEEIELQPIVSPLEALQGRMAGVEIEQGSGITGLAPKIRIRGQNSIRNSLSDNGNYPLYIINGIPINSQPLNSGGLLTNITGIDPLSTLSLNNIESIEVLKDADATAIYGSRGANGVILITTKSGSYNQGRTSIEISLYSGVSEVANKVKLLNTQQYLSMRRRAFENDGIAPTARNAPDLVLWDQNRYTDWQDVLFGRTATMTNISTSISGGNEHNNFLIGGTFLKQGSVFPGNFDYNKLTFNFNFNHRSKNNRFQLGVSANYGVDTNKLFTGGNFVNNALSIPPNAPPIYNEDDDLNWENWIRGNPFAIFESPQDLKKNSLLANINMSYNILSELILKVNMGYSNLDSKELIRNFKESYNPSIWDRRPLTASKSITERISWIIEPQLNYVKHFKNLNINALIGGTFQDNNNDYLSLDGSGYADNSLVGNLNAADEVRSFSDENINYRYAAMFGRLGMNWNLKYYLNITGRRDGSSRFGPNKRFSNFWAVGGAWIFSRENIIKRYFPFISFGKLRGSYGTTGNDQISDYGFLDAYEPTDGVGGLYPTQLFNSNYSWEVNKKLETAIQLGLLKDRINMEVSWYRNRSSNQLVGYPLPALTGFTSVQANLPALVQNSGWEILLNTRNINNKKVKWSTTLNITFPENKLLEFDNIEQTPYSLQYKIGQPLDISFRYQFDGIDPETGLYKVVDINNDGSLNTDDRVVIKQMGRKFYGGISNMIRYNGLSLQFLFQYVNQDNINFIFESSAPGRLNNKPIQFMNSWKSPSDNGKIQKISQTSTARRAFYNAGNSNIGIADASFLRLKNLSISYQLPEQLCEKLNIQTLNLFFRAQNLLTLTSYKGLDPQGGRVIPPLRTVTCGIQANL